MNLMTDGTGIATMLGGLSVLTATSVWVRGQWRQRQEQKAVTRSRNWSGYIDRGGINEWYVRLVEDPKTVTSTVVLEVVDSKGEPHGGRAHDLRERIKRDGQVARVPTPEEYDFLKYLQKKRGYGKGFPVGQEEQSAFPQINEG